MPRRDSLIDRAPDAAASPTPEPLRHARRSAASFAQARSAGADSAETEGLYRLLVDSVQDYAIFGLDPDGYILSWNAGAEHAKGYTAAEIVGQHFSIFYPAEKIAERFPEHELEVAGREGRFEDEGWRIRKDGSRFWANVVITALRNPQGTLVGFAKVTRDLTERRAAEEQRLADAQRIAAAEASNKAKSEFLASMSHELRTPLNAIGGYMELLLDGLYGPVPEEQQEVLQRVRRSQQHLLTIITDLLNYSRVEAGQITYDLAPVSVPAMLENVSAMMEAQARRKGLTLERGSCPRQAVARVDRSRAEQILLNLLSNAVKFTPEGGRITLSCARRGDRVTVRVHDTGPGLPPDKLEAVFEPFVQLGPLAQQRARGDGARTRDQPRPGPRDGRRSHCGERSGRGRHVHPHAARRVVAAAWSRPGAWPGTATGPATPDRTVVRGRSFVDTGSIPSRLRPVVRTA